LLAPLPGRRTPCLLVLTLIAFTAACGGAQAMQSGRAAEEVRALRAALAAGAVEVGGRARCYVARGSVMPYKAWWANKVAI